MPFALRENPDFLSPDDLDDYWSRGWFRMRQTLFTTHFLEFEGEFYSAVWLRVDLRGWVNDRRFEALRKKNQRFRVTFGRSQPVPDAALEDLFTRYRESLTIEVAASLADLMVGHETSSIFDTWEVRVFDDETLIAAGYFDRGRQGAAGITAFYDPHYHRHSLGKYLIYLKMEFCRDHGLVWFYPGYVVPGRPRFDYKLDLASAHLEYLDLASGEWVDLVGAPPDPLALMVDRLTQVGLPLWFNLHLSIHLSPQVQGVELFDFPVFLNVLPREGGPVYLLVVFDPRDGLYHLVQTRSVYAVVLEDPQPGRFGSDLLKVERLLFSTPSAEEIVAAIQFVTA